MTRKYKHKRKRPRNVDEDAIKQAIHVANTDGVTVAQMLKAAKVTGAEPTEWEWPSEPVPTGLTPVADTGADSSGNGGVGDNDVVSLKASNPSWSASTLAAVSRLKSSVVQAVLPHFWGLSSDAQRERALSVDAIVRCIQEVGPHPEDGPRVRSYVVGRLLRGVGSSTGAARQGFAAGLTHVIALLMGAVAGPDGPANDTDAQAAKLVWAPAVVADLEKSPSEKGGLTSQERRDNRFRIVLGSLALLKGAELVLDSQTSSTKGTKGKSAKAKAARAAVAQRVLDAFGFDKDVLSRIILLINDTVLDDRMIYSLGHTVTQTIIDLHKDVPQRLHEQVIPILEEPLSLPPSAFTPMLVQLLGSLMSAAPDLEWASILDPAWFAGFDEPSEVTVAEWLASPATLAGLAAGVVQYRGETAGHAFRVATTLAELMLDTAPDTLVQFAAELDNAAKAASRSFVKGLPVIKRILAMAQALLRTTVGSVSKTKAAAAIAPITDAMPVTLSVASRVVHATIPEAESLASGVATLMDIVLDAAKAARKVDPLVPSLSKLSIAVAAPLSDQAAVYTSFAPVREVVVKYVGSVMFDNFVSDQIEALFALDMPDAMTLLCAKASPETRAPASILAHESNVSGIISRLVGAISSADAETLTSASTLRVLSLLAMVASTVWIGSPEVGAAVANGNAEAVAELDAKARANASAALAAVFGGEDDSSSRRRTRRKAASKSAGTSSAVELPYGACVEDIVRVPLLVSTPKIVQAAQAGLFNALNVLALTGTKPSRKASQDLDEWAKATLGIDAATGELWTAQLLTLIEILIPHMTELPTMARVASVDGDSVTEALTEVAGLLSSSPFNASGRAAFAAAAAELPAELDEPKIMALYGLNVLVQFLAVFLWTNPELSMAYIVGDIASAVFKIATGEEDGTGAAAMSESDDDASVDEEDGMPGPAPSPILVIADAIIGVLSVPSSVLRSAINLAASSMAPLFTQPAIEHMIGALSQSFGEFAAERAPAAADALDDFAPIDRSALSNKTGGSGEDEGSGDDSDNDGGDSDDGVAAMDMEDDVGTNGDAQAEALRAAILTEAENDNKLQAALGLGGKAGDDSDDSGDDSDDDSDDDGASSDSSLPPATDEEMARLDEVLVSVFRASSKAYKSREDRLAQHEFNHFKDRLAGFIHTLLESAPENKIVLDAIPGLMAMLWGGGARGTGTDMATQDRVEKILRKLAKSSRVTLDTTELALRASVVTDKLFAAASSASRSSTRQTAEVLLMWLGNRMLAPSCCDVDALRSKIGALIIKYLEAKAVNSKSRDFTVTKFLEKLAAQLPSAVVVVLPKLAKLLAQTSSPGSFLKALQFINRTLAQYKTVAKAMDIDSFVSVVNELPSTLFGALAVHVDAIVQEKATVARAVLQTLNKSMSTSAGILATHANGASVTIDDTAAAVATLETIANSERARTSQAIAQQVQNLAKNLALDVDVHYFAIRAKNKKAKVAAERTAFWEAKQAKQAGKGKSKSKDKSKSKSKSKKSKSKKSKSKQ